MEQSQVIDKIRKLLALANRAGTEEEAAAAAGKAQELLAQYNLEMAQIDAAPESTKATTAEGRRTKEKYTRSAMFAWQRALWKAISEANYCWYEAIPVYKVNSLGVELKANYHHYLIGRESNVVTTKLMGDYLEETISRLCPYKPGRDSSKSWNSWKEGCAARLAQRLSDKRTEMENQSRQAADAAAAAGGTGMALMTLTDVAQTEDDLNYREKYGEEAYQNRLRSRHNWRVCQCDYCREQKARYDRYIEESKTEVIVPKSAAEQRREDAQWEKTKRRWAREEERDRRREQKAWANKDQVAFYEGAHAADSIGLDPQVSKPKDRNQIG